MFGFSGSYLLSRLLIKRTEYKPEIESESKRKVSGAKGKTSSWLNRWFLSPPSLKQLLQHHWCISVRLIKAGSCQTLAAEITKCYVEVNDSHYCFLKKQAFRYSHDIKGLIILKITINCQY
jgi:hypothetical protein